MTGWSHRSSVFTAQNSGSCTPLQALVVVVVPVVVLVVVVVDFVVVVVTDIVVVVVFVTVVVLSVSVVVDVSVVVVAVDVVLVNVVDAGVQNPSASHATQNLPRNVPSLSSSSP